MSFYEHETEFAGMPVVDFESGTPIDPDANCYRLRVEYDSDVSAVDLLSELLEDPAADRLTGLVIGAWAGELWEIDSSHIVEALVAAAPRLPALRALFIGDITMEENEVSWIKQTDISPIWTAFPKLENLQLRGSDGLSLGTVAHDALQALTIQCGGLPKNVLKEITEAKLPALEAMVLFLGEENYGFDGDIDDVKRFLTESKLPRLTYLGLCDSEIADEVAIAVTESELLNRITALDLSLGTLSDNGAQALLKSEGVAKLERLIIEHHYIGDEIVKQLEALPIETSINERQEGDMDDGVEYRYIAVSE